MPSLDIMKHLDIMRHLDIMKPPIFRLKKFNIGMPIIVVNPPLSIFFKEKIFVKSFF
jgi:hypothetical protein